MLCPVKLTSSCLACINARSDTKEYPVARFCSSSSRLPVTHNVELLALPRMMAPSAIFHLVATDICADISPLPCPPARTWLLVSLAFLCALISLIVISWVELKVLNL